MKVNRTKGTLVACPLLRFWREITEDRKNMHRPARIRIRDAALRKSSPLARFHAKIRYQEND
jgi:hypothetical protein